MGRTGDVHASTVPTANGPIVAAKEGKKKTIMIF
jgi:hypothetical protein